jgi:O-methyltransferase involved in polyketide biosynthesis
MSSSEAYLGAFENPSQVTVTFDREMLEQAFQTLAFDDNVTVSEEQWKQVFEAVYKSDLVSDFIHNLVDIAHETLVQK